MTTRVFLVEDMKQVHAALAELLAAVGDFRVVGVAGTEAEANLWLLENAGAWDLAIIDLVLEQGTGMSVVPKAAEAAQRDGGSIVVCSDYASEGIRAQVLRRGLFDEITPAPSGRELTLTRRFPAASIAR